MVNGGRGHCFKLQVLPRPRGRVLDPLGTVEIQGAAAHLGKPKFAVRALPPCIGLFAGDLPDIEC